MSSSGMLDVLVARIASGRARRSRSAKSVRFASTFSKIASMTTSARATPWPAMSGTSRSAASRARRGSRSRSPNSVRARCIAGARRFGLLVLQRDRQPAQRAPRGDVAAHRAAADTCTCATFGTAFLAERLQALLQPEDAQQVRRGRALHERQDRRRIVGRRRERVAVVARPQVEDRVGRRIVLAAARAARPASRACAAISAPHRRPLRQRQRERQRARRRVPRAARRARCCP